MEPAARRTLRTSLGIIGTATLLGATAATIGTVGAAPSETSAAELELEVLCDTGEVAVSSDKDISNIKFYDDGAETEELLGPFGETATVDIVDGADSVSTKSGTTEEEQSIDCGPTTAPAEDDDNDAGTPEESPEAPDEESPEAPDEETPEAPDEEAPEDDGEEASAAGSDAEIDAVFDCESVSITSTKDLSNVVLEFEDGSVQKFDGLSDTEGTFAGTGEHDGALVTGVWVKSGANASGDGPGYGERFDAPTQTCEADPAA